MKKGRRDPWYLRFHDLMPFRVREILLVSSAYDAFILEEDGRLDERLYTAYADLSLTAAPHIVHAATVSEALEALDRRSFDLVLTFARLEEGDATALSRAVKQRHPRVGVVLLVFDEGDLRHFPGRATPDSIDHTFLWSGDARTLLAAIKIVEDERNVEHDTSVAGVQTILVVEDKIRPYSTFLGLLYGELMAQSHSLLAEGLNAAHRRLRTRARPKVLLAQTFERALSLAETYHDTLLALITDLRFPRGGVEDAEAGAELVRRIRAESPDLPVLVHSAEPNTAGRHPALSAWHVAKSSTSVHAEVRKFLQEALGFGDFVFRLPDRTEVGRASDVYELSTQLRTVAAKSVEFHASRNHFSTWLNARGRFALAGRVRARKVAEFADAEGIRRYLAAVLHEELRVEQEGVIADFSPRQGGPPRRFVRVGQGSIGGKGRGLAFVSSMLVRHGLADRFPGLEIAIPSSVVIGAGEFDRFLDATGISRSSLLVMDEAEVLRRFLAADLGEELRGDLAVALAEHQGPLAVRSSSLLEDSRFQPFAGVYATYMLPMTSGDPKAGLREVCQAIKAVYASTFSAAARSYLARTPHSVEDEKMAIVVQEVVGRRHDGHFYPHVSGVAQSYNYYPVTSQRAEDGVAVIALGLGQAVVSGRAGLRFSPACPNVLPQLSSPRSFLRSSQSEFYALDLTRSEIDFSKGGEASLAILDLAAAERHGTLAPVASVYSAADDALRDNLGHAGPRVVTFANLLKWRQIPLAPALDELLRLFKSGLGSDVEIEFALDLGDPKAAPSDHAPCLHLLQIRPMTVDSIDEPAGLETRAHGPVLCRTGRALGHGIIRSVRDVIYVKPIQLDGTKTRAIAGEIGRINAELCAEGADYLLIGPGRWGSQDPSLGIPVDWNQIGGVRVLVETRMNGRAIEPSQGTHFFHNITALRIGYLTVTADPAEEMVDFAWLDDKPALHDTGAVRHVRLEAPLEIELDGRHGSATVWAADPPA